MNPVKSIRPNTIKWRRIWLDSRGRLIRTRSWPYRNRRTNLKSWKQWWNQRLLLKKKESNSMNSDHNCKHCKVDLQTMPKLKQKKMLKTRENHSAKHHKGRWWHQIVQSISTTSHESRHPQLVTVPRELEACFLQTRIHWQWADQPIKAEHVSGIGWWKKEKSCLRRVLTRRTTHLSRKLSAKYNRASWKGKQIFQQVQLRSIREFQLSDRPCRLSDKLKIHSLHLFY